MVVFMGNCNCYDKAMNWISSNFPNYNGDFIFADYNQFFLRKNEYENGWDINDLTEYGKNVLKYPFEELGYDQTNVDTYAFSFGTYIAKRAHPRVFPKSTTNRIFLVNALSNPAKHIDKWLFPGVGKLIRWALLSEGLNDSDIDDDWAKIDKDVKMAVNTADDNVVLEGSSLYHNSKKEEDNVYLVRHNSATSIAWGNIGHGHNAPTKNLNTKKLKSNHDECYNVRDMANDFFTNKNEKNEEILAQGTGYRERWSNIILNGLWWVLRVILSIPMLFVVFPIAVAVKYWKITVPIFTMLTISALIISLVFPPAAPIAIIATLAFKILLGTTVGTAMLANLDKWKLSAFIFIAAAVASFFVPGLPLVIAGIAGFKIFMGCAVGISFLANIEKIGEWIQENPKTFLLALGVVSLLIGLSVIFFPATPIALSLGALAIKITAITSLVIGGISLLTLLYKGVRNCIKSSKNKNNLRQKEPKINEDHAEK